MKTKLINGNEVKFFIDYVKVPKKANHNYSNVDFDYNCDLSITTNKELTDYEREIIARHILNIVNCFDERGKE